jgi:RNA 3'-terminal phosphate cyclase (ATP)
MIGSKRRGSMIRIDGSSGEGGGQILRSSLSLSLATGEAFRIENVRAKRERPGLLRQHLTAVLAAAEIAGAEVAGASLGSRTLSFVPGTVRPGDYRFVIGTAGSGTLVLQTILPALMTASAASRITIEGGTHNLAAPPFDFLQRCFLPVISRVGPKVSVNLERHGFYPAGGGCFTALIEPCARLSPLDLTERGEITQRKATAIVANLSRAIAQRELDTVARLLNWEKESMELIEAKNSIGPGNVVLIDVATSTGLAEQFCGFGRLGASAESVATEAVKEARAYLVSNAAVGEHLADQLLLPFALAGGGVFTAEKLNRHARTNMEVITNFLPVNFTTGEETGRIRIAVTSRA